MGRGVVMESVFCIAATQRLADQMLQGLKEAQVPAEAVSVVAPGRWTPWDRRGGVSTRLVRSDPDQQVIEDTMAWLSVVRQVTVEDVGSVLAVGPVLAAMEQDKAGAGRRLSSALMRLGLPAFEADRYVRELAAGRILLGVHAAQRELAQRGEQVFEQYAGEQIGTAVQTERG